MGSSESTISFNALRKAIEIYTPLSEDTWLGFKNICTFTIYKKNEFFCRENEIASYFGFVYSGLLRSYITNSNGKEYTKIFFPENTFPGSMVSLLTSCPSHFAIQSLEPSTLIQINFKNYRELLSMNDEIKSFHINYLERNWLIEKEQREVSLVQDSGSHRYQDFLKNNPRLEQRLSQHHIASHLGITPTQLSRIRKNLK